MRAGSTWQWRKQAAILVLGFVSLGGISLSRPGRHFLYSARNFVQCYQALEEAGVPAGFFERVVFSLVLASADPPGPARSNATAM